MLGRAEPSGNIDTALFSGDALDQPPGTPLGRSAQPRGGQTTPFQPVCFKKMFNDLSHIAHTRPDELRREKKAPAPRPVRDN